MKQESDEMSKFLSFATVEKSVLQGAHDSGIHAVKYYISSVFQFHVQTLASPNYL